MYRIKTNGSLPRDNRKSGTSSPTSPSSPSTSMATFSPTSSSIVWPNAVTLSPLSLRASEGSGGGVDDSVFYENENGPSSLKQTSGCGSPRTKIKTIPVSTVVTTAAIAVTTTSADTFRLG